MRYAYQGAGDSDLSDDDLVLAEVVEDAPIEVLHGVDLAVRPGTTVAVVGPTGSGKSTLAGLLVRLVDPASGEVLLDGVDARAVRPRGHRRAPRPWCRSPPSSSTTPCAATSPSAPPTRHGVELDDDAVWEALRLAQGDRFVAALPSGLDTRVGERGTSLSGGQRQRIALARAVVRSPRLLVLDDATSAVDPRVEQAILGGLRESTDGLTVVVVAYRKATIAVADEVVFVERGRVVDRGTHADLLERQPRYRHLVNAYEEEAAAR